MIPEIRSVIDDYPPAQQKALHKLHDLIVETASQTDTVGKLEQSLKWSQPAYSAKTGSPISIDAVRDSETKYAMYFICTTKLVSRFRERYPEEFKYEGNRAILFETGEPFDEAALKHCIAMALTYKLDR